MLKTKNWKRAAAITACSALLAASTLGGFATLTGRAAPAYSASYTVDLQKTLQTFDGWGLSLSWWAVEMGDWTRVGSSGTQKREEIMEALYGESGLNLNIARYNIGGGDNPTHTHLTYDRGVPGWQGATKNEDGSYTPGEYYFKDENDEDIPWEKTPDVNQLWVLDWIQNRHGADGDNDLLTEFYSNSPPYWMTISECSAGGEGAGQNMVNDEAHNQAFVNYFLDVYEYLTSQGFILENLQPFNESGSKFWGTNGDQEGCYFSADQKVEVLSLLVKEMEKRKADHPELYTDTVYNWGDETNPTVAWNEYSSAIQKTSSKGGLTGKEVVSGASRFTYHLYDNADQGPQERLYRAAKSMGQQLYMSEITWAGSAKDYDPNDMSCGFNYVKSIVDSVKAGADAFIFWQGMEDMVGQIKSHTNYGLIQGVYNTQEEGEAQGVDLASMGFAYQDYVLAKAFYLSGQYTKYIRQGYSMIKVDNGDTIAAVSPDGQTLVIIRRNNSDNGASFKYDLSGFKATSVEKIYTDKTHNWEKTYAYTDGNSIVDTVTPSSVTTYVIHGENGMGNGYFIDESAAKHGTSLAQMKSAFAANPEVEQLYTELTTHLDDGGNAVFGGQTAYTGDEKYIGYHFFGTGFGLTAPQKSDAGTYSIWIDKDPASSQPDQVVELYKNVDKAVIGEMVYRNNELDEGWHTVYLKTGADSAGHKWVNFDGLFVYTSEDHDLDEKSLIINDAGGIVSGDKGTVKFNYTASGLTGYKIYPEYRTGATAWLKGEKLTPAPDQEITVDKANSIILRLVAEKTGEDNYYSPEYVVNLAQQTGNILYYADCGTSNPAGVAAGAVLGTAQSASDQKWGKDPATGLEWGYTNDLTGYYTTDDAMSSMWSLDKTSESKIEYKFTIPTAGTYTVTLGFFGGGSGWKTRAEKITVGTQTATVTVKEGEYSIKTFEVTTTAENEVLTVSVEKNASGEQAAQLSAIVIAPQGEAIPLYTSGASSYNSAAITSQKEILIGGNLYEEVEKETFTVYLSNGSVDKEISATDEGVSYYVETEVIKAGQTMKAIFTVEGYEGLELYASYVWTQAGATVLYYNIDAGYTGDYQHEGNSTPTPPDDKPETLGTKQSSTRDRVYGEDAAKGTSWGYVGSNFGNGVNWGDNRENKWSIREGKDTTDGKSSLTYKMTGFDPNEALKIGVSGHCGSWSTRTFTVIANGVTLGDVTLTKSADPVELDFTGASANSDGELTVICKQKSGDGPQVSYIKVWSDGENLPKEKTITADKNTVAGNSDNVNDRTVTLRSLTAGATVYVLDENNNILGSKVAEGTSMTIDAKDYVREGVYELHFTQAVANVSSPSTELVVAVLGIDVAIKNADEAVESGVGAAVIVFTPHAVNGVTSLKVLAPDKNMDDVTIDVSGDFFYRAPRNGVYTAVLVSNGVEFRKQFTVSNIDEVEFIESRNHNSWTNENVTISLELKSTYGIKQVLIDGVVTEPVNGKYSMTTEENNTENPFEVTVETTKGHTYTRYYSVDYIDKGTPTFEVEFDFTISSGVTLKHRESAYSDGTLYVSHNGGAAKAVADPESLILEQAGKYEIYYTNGAGVSTSKVTYYVTYGLKSKLASGIGIGGDGNVVVNGVTTAKLYRAGEEGTILKAEKKGKYYLQLEKDGEVEIVVFTIGAPVEKNNNGIMIAGIVIGAAAIAAAAAVCVVFFMKGRKKS